MNELLGAAPQQLLKATESGLSAGTVASVVITGIVVVFIGLIILIVCVAIYGKGFDSAAKRREAKAKAEAQAKLVEAAKGVPVPEASVASNAAAPALDVEDGIEEEIVAVIAAAIAAMGAAQGKKLALRSVRTAKGSRSAWAAAGIAENTRPF